MATSPKGRRKIIRGLAANKPPREIKAELAKDGETISTVGIWKHANVYKKSMSEIEFLSNAYIEKQKEEASKLWGSSWVELIKVTQASIKPIIKKLSEGQGLTKDEQEILFKGIKTIEGLTERLVKLCGGEQPAQTTVNVLQIIDDPDKRAALHELAERIRADRGRRTGSGRSDDEG